MEFLFHRNIILQRQYFKSACRISAKENEKGFEIITVKGWDYPGLIEAYQKAEKICREEHVPVLFHVEEITQPQGHSTSGSHERYKSKERLEWEVEYDCIRKMREWIIKEVIVLPKKSMRSKKKRKNLPSKHKIAHGKLHG